MVHRAHFFRFVGLEGTERTADSTEIAAHVCPARRGESYESIVSVSQHSPCGFLPIKNRCALYRACPLQYSYNTSHLNRTTYSSILPSASVRRPTGPAVGHADASLRIQLCSTLLYISDEKRWEKNNALSCFPHFSYLLAAMPVLQHRED